MLRCLVFVVSAFRACSMPCDARGLLIDARCVLVVVSRFVIVIVICWLSCDVWHLLVVVYCVLLV